MSHAGSWYKTKKSPVSVTQPTFTASSRIVANVVGNLKHERPLRKEITKFDFFAFSLLALPQTLSTVN
jgi:hypothetical protein